MGTVSLKSILDIEQIDDLIFRGFTPQGGTGRVYGGQVIAQGLSAASHTVDNRPCHSLHAYLLRPGDRSKPIIYDVDIARDGRSFSSRRVTAIQNGKQILNMALSFQGEEPGLEHDGGMPDVPAPETLKSLQELQSDIIDKIPEEFRENILRKRAYEVRPVTPMDYLNPQPIESLNNVWIRLTDDTIPNDADHQRLVLAYMSDLTLLDSGLRVHGKDYMNTDIQTASLDHALWFYHPYQIDEWLLFSQHSPVTGAGRGLNFASIYTRDGKLVASACQEGLMRERS